MPTGKYLDSILLVEGKIHHSLPWISRTDFWAPVLPLQKKSYLQVFLKNLDVVNDLSNKRAKFQLEKLCILSYTKMTSVDLRFWV
jgi:hypothetical protein